MCDWRGLDMRRPGVPLSVVFVLGLVLALAPPGAAAPRSAQVTLIQAVPGASVDVELDGRPVAGGAAVGEVLGPFDVAPGEHDIVFRDGDLQVDSSLMVRAGTSSDVVLHLPADPGGDPVVHSYRAPTGPIGPGKARVVLAHTATVAPADVRVDGQTVFTNIANGEFAEADVPAGTIRVALLPSGTAGDPILGPLDVTVEASTLSMIYAYGNPRDRSMNVISHTSRLEADGSVRPSVIDTGSAGLVREQVVTFDAERSGAALWAALVSGPALAGSLFLVAWRRRPRPGPRATPTR